MSKASVKKTAAELLFFGGYIVWLVWKLIGVSMFSFPEGSPVNTGLHIASYILLIASCLLSVRFDSTLLLAVLFGILGVLVKVASDDIDFVDLALILYAAHCTSFTRVAKVSLVVLGIGAVIIVLSSQVGIIPDYPFMRGDTVRHGLGFRYCTSLSHLYLNLVLLFLFLRRDDIRIAECILLLALDVGLYALTESRNSCGLVVVALILALFFKCSDCAPVGRALCFMSRYAFVTFTILGIIAALAYNPNSSSWALLNDITSNRIAQDHASLIKYGVQPFGQEIEFANRVIAMGETDQIEWETAPEGDKNIVESSFLNILINNGYVALITVLAAFWVALKTNRDRWMALIMLMIACHSAFDFQLVNLLYTTFLIWVWNEVSLSLESSSIGTRINTLSRKHSLLGDIPEK